LSAIPWNIHLHDSMHSIVKLCTSLIQMMMGFAVDMQIVDIVPSSHPREGHSTDSVALGTRDTTPLGRAGVIDPKQILGNHPPYHRNCPRIRC